MSEPEQNELPYGSDRLLVDEASALVAVWLDEAEAAVTRAERRQNLQLQGVVADAAGVKFAMGFVDRVIRPEDSSTAAHQLVSLVEESPLPDFLSAADKMLLRAGARLAPVLPGIVIPLAVRRMRGMVKHLVIDAEQEAMGRYLSSRRGEGFGLNVNLLGEAVLGEAEADRRHREAMTLLDQPDVDYVSVKTSAVVSQLNYWDYATSVQRVIDRLRPLFRKAAATSPRTFINLDMEEYHDLELTMTAFMALLDEPEFHRVDAGIVIQAYLPDSLEALQQLVAWANERGDRQVDGYSGGVIKVRLVKGANLAMEKVEAAIAGWPQAPYTSKAATDANYKRCLDWVMTPDRLGSVRIGVASHNLFDVAWAHLLSEQRKVAERVSFEMLQGMAPAQARVTKAATGELLLYSPAVAETDFDVAISYLFRRLEENAADENFIRHLFAMRPGDLAFKAEAAKFGVAVEERWAGEFGPRRVQNRLVHDDQQPDDGPGQTDRFVNEPDTDPSIPANRQWAAEVVAVGETPPRSAMVDDMDTVDSVVTNARAGQAAWAARSVADRAKILHAVGDELNRRRGDLISAMVYEASKTFEQADPEVSEAIDFARYYGRQAERLEGHETVRFEPLGVMAIVPPWNFPVAICTGGVMGSIAAGNAAILKPPPETPRCAEIVAECCWAAGVPRDVVQFLRVPDNDTGRHLITHQGVDGIILTGAYETAELFRSWKPDLRIFAETSGKNALVITPNADIDLAVADLVASAFGHAGQKCSAASLAICVGDVYTSERFRRQLSDAVASLQVGDAADLGTNLGPTIHEPDGKLLRALSTLEPGEEWLVEPRRLGPRTWTPGVKLGVRAGSWFHQTECFGPVLGVMHASDLGEALTMQNGVSFGLTGGIHSLDDAEVDRWLDKVEVGNVYINRVITGAIVQRQPFGGWKRSAIGPGAKAGGPNYVAQLGTWHSVDGIDLEAAQRSDADAWNTEFSQEHDPTGLFCEANVLRYRPLRRVALRVESDATGEAIERVRAAAKRCDVALVESHASSETAGAFAARLESLDVDRVRVVGTTEQALHTVANRLGLHVADGPVTDEGRVELLHYLREQAISRTMHRYGNLL